MAGPVVLGNPADTWTNSKDGYKTKNYGSTTIIRLKTDPGETRRGWMYFGLPIPLGCTVTSAVLYLRTLDNWPGGVTVSVQKANAAWSVNKITDSNKPSVMGPVATAGPANWGKHQTIQVDVTALLQEVANGGAWYGFRIMASGTEDKEIASAQNGTAWLRPALVVSWVDAPRPPVYLSPSGNRALSNPKPILTFDYTDPSADSPINACRVQIDPAGNWAAPAWDSGEVGTSIPQLDLAATSYPGLAPDMSTYWRVAVKDAGGLWSGWSHIVAGQGAQFRYVAQGVVTITNPSDKLVATNLLTNPDFETDVTGWATNGTATFTQDLTEYHPGGLGIASGKFVASAGESLYASPQPASVDGDHAMSLWVKGTAGNHATLELAKLPGGAVFGTSGAVALTGGWQRLTVVADTADVATTNVYPVLVAQEAQTIWVDDGTLVEGTIVRDFNGDSLYAPDAMAQSFGWNGTPHASTSWMKNTELYDPTPPITWTFSLVQRHWQVLFTDAADPGNVIHTSGKISGPETTYTPPVSVLMDTGKTYKVIVRIWDTTDREQNGAIPVYTETSKNFVFAYDGTVLPITSFVGTLDPVVPKVSLTWERIDIPDWWAIVRDGVVIDYLSGADLQTGPTTYRYDDYSAGGRSSHTWVVRPIVNGAWNDGPEFTAYIDVRFPWLFRTDGTDPVALYNPKRDMALRNNQELHDVVGNHPPVLITQVLGGMAGHLEGLIVNDIIEGVTAKRMLENFKRIRLDAGTPMQLMLVDEAFLVVPYNMTYEVDPSSPEGLAYWIKFDWVAIDR